MSNYDILLSSVDQTHKQLKDCLDCGRPVPSWLQKKAEAIIEMGTDWQRGVAMMIDGLQDESDHLRSVETQSMEPGKILEWAGLIGEAQ